ncbi:MAG TPA: hypothetical protein DEB06_08545 [Phycisphaerales bacterium]|nr:hypothetical protein [Phycisphaerales bacterium]
MRLHCAVTVGVALASASGAAFGGVLFTYEDPNAKNQEFRVFAPQKQGDNGTIQFDSEQVLRLRIDASEEQPGAVVEVDARLSFIDMIVGPASQVGNSLIGQSAGRFEFRTADEDNELIIAGEFEDGVLLTLFDAGSQQTAMNEAGGTLVLTPGPALFTILLEQADYALPGIDPNGPSSAAWGLANIDEINPSSLLGEGPGRYFPDFDADSAFVGRFEVPAPGAVVLTGLSGLALVARRRR